jgi:hypothetical protein
MIYRSRLNTCGKLDPKIKAFILLSMANSVHHPLEKFIVLLSVAEILNIFHCRRLTL